MAVGDMDDSAGVFCTGSGLTMFMDGFTSSLRHRWWRFSPATQRRRTPPGCLMLFFDAWTLTSEAKFVGACAGVACVAAAVEAVGALRRVRATHHVANSNDSFVVKLETACLYGVQLTMGYFLMLAVMTYSSEIFASAVSGIVAGHLLFRNWGKCDWSRCSCLGPTKPDLSSAMEGCCGGFDDAPQYQLIVDDVEQPPFPADSLGFSVPAMTCESCVTTVRTSLLACAGVQAVRIDLNTKTVVVYGRCNLFVLVAALDRIRGARGIQSGRNFGFGELKASLDGEFFGRSRTVEALLLAVVAREHAYVEGPPGCGKTQLAERVGKALGLRYWAYQFHRDTRLSEIVGDAAIERERRGEIVRQRSIRGGLLTAEVAVLDEVSRAPGEALNALLRTLIERTDDAGAPLPLASCFATGNPPSEDHYNEALDPAALDRFAVHARSADLENAARVIEARATGSGAVEPSGRVDAAAAIAAAARIELDETMRGIFLRFVRELRGNVSALCGWSDRTLLGKSCKLVRAAAVLDGQKSAKPRHLLALAHLFDFRVLPRDRPKIDDLLAAVVADAPTDDDDEDGGNFSFSEKRRQSAGSVAVLPRQGQAQTYLDARAAAADIDRLSTTKRRKESIRVLTRRLVRAAMRGRRRARRGRAENSTGLPLDFDYAANARVAASVECGGLANVESAPRRVLDDLQRRRHDARRDHVVLVTDGQPTEGSIDDLRKQVDRAAALGICVHPVFIGHVSAMPDEFLRIAPLTSGALFHAPPRLPEDDDALLLRTTGQVTIDLVDQSSFLRR
ncbi:hypothetical protein CTAYLR_006004 [Chrysophaeum taylorii]|uniref:HMA domain-containing protein n=1 Tax=Chrysophaeum taylorii TaxID=2483200 RepID=A0AAD7U4Q7_9STRA|nr:hypothetical protein CTAYLR_006004 [Chrysophaeum taylorii]